MWKLTFALRRAPHLSLEEFQEYWYEKHAPLVQKHRKVLGIRRYVQVHARDVAANEALRGSRGAPEPYDGVAELWFDSPDFATTAEAQAAGAELLEDEKRFIDLARSPLWLSEEKPIFED